MSETITYNSSTDSRPYRNIRLCVSNDVLLAALEEYERKTGMDLDEIAKEGLIRLLEEENESS